MEAIQTVIRVQNIRYDKAEEALYIIDQTKLPGEEREIRLRTVEEMEEAIRALRVRGAPAIGIDVYKRQDRSRWHHCRWKRRGGRGSECPGNRGCTP